MATTAKEFLMGLPEKVSPEAIEGQNTVFHFDLKEGDNYTLKIEEGKMIVTEGLDGEPECVIKAKGTDLMDVIEGRQNPMMAFMMGKIKASNQGAIMKYAKTFGFM